MSRSIEDVPVQGWLPGGRCLVWRNLFYLQTTVLVLVLVFDIRLRRMIKSQNRKQRSMNTLRNVLGKNDCISADNDNEGVDVQMTAIEDGKIIHLRGHSEQASKPESKM